MLDGCDFSPIAAQPDGGDSAQRHSPRASPSLSVLSVPARPCPSPSRPRPCPSLSVPDSRHRPVAQPASSLARGPIQSRPAAFRDPTSTQCSTAPARPFTGRRRNARRMAPGRRGVVQRSGASVCQGVSATKPHLAAHRARVGDDEVKKLRPLSTTAPLKARPQCAGA